MFMFGNERFELKFKLGSIRGDLIEIMQATDLLCLSEARGALKQAGKLAFVSLHLSTIQGVLKQEQDNYLCKSALMHHLGCA